MTPAGDPEVTVAHPTGGHPAPAAAPPARPAAPDAVPDRAGALGAATVASSRPSSTTEYAAGAASGLPLARSPRRARLQVRRVDPWSVLKTTLLYSLCLLVVLLVAVAALYAVLSAMGVFDSLNTAIRDLTDSGGAASTGGLQVIFSAPRILLWTGLLGAVNVVLITALATLGAVLYNLCAEVWGGIEVTLAEQE